jgi:hypothetical protein
MIRHQRTLAVLQTAPPGFLSQRKKLKTREASGAKQSPN